ncbi:MAG: AMP-binding protein, partial [Thiotrichales bacterium]|nr:AMP-binding protein [Thiotrichales bacterium]
MIIKFAKLLLRTLLRCLYGVRVSGLQHYHEAGDKVLIVANHTSLLDGVLLYAWLPVTPTFAINTRIAEQPLFKPFLKFVDLFIMDPTNPLSIKSMIRFINQNNKAVIFPEGRITTTGTLMKIYEGPGLIADKSAASILPIAIEGTQYSPFSYMKGRGRIVMFPRISLTILPPQTIDIAPEIHGHARRRAAALKMQDIMFHLIYSTYNHRQDLFSAFIEARNKFGKSTVIVEDINREPASYQQLLLKILVLASLIKKDSLPGERIGVLLPNVVAMPVVFLTLQYLRRVPAMLNFTSGLQNIMRACETGQINTIYTSRKFVTNAGLEEIADELGKHFKLIYLEDLRERLTLLHKLAGLLKSRFPKFIFRKTARQISPDDPAVILFTSGSEGVPKGVVLTHSNLLSNYAQVRCHID